MQISVNNELHTLQSDSSIADLLELLEYDCKNVAVAVNTDFVPRGQYAQQYLKAGDQVDIVAPIQGG